MAVGRQTLRPKKRININEPDIAKEEKSAVLSVLKSKVFTSSSTHGGPNVQELERRLKKYIGTKYAVAVNSGTSALYCALAAATIGPNVEVALPSFTFVATANVLMALGARPLFVDINRDDYTISAEDLESRLSYSKRVKAVIPVHLYGYPAKMAEIIQISRDHDAKVIEDAAQSIGSTYNSKQTGSLGDCGCFSFYAAKVVMSGEGGAVVTKDDEMYERLIAIRNHGMTSPYMTRLLGLNFRMPEIEAAIAAVQIQKIPKLLKIRLRNASILRDELQNQPGIILPPVDGERKNNYYLFTISVAKRRDKLQKFLEMRGIDARVFYPLPVHKNPFYLENGFDKVSLPNTDWAAAHVLSLPVHPGLSEEEMKVIANEVKRGVRQIVIT
jgi:perosamine synthetase